MGLGPVKVLLAVIPKGHARPFLRLLTQDSYTRLPLLHRRAPAGLVKDSGAPLVINAHGVGLQRAHSFLMNVPTGAGEPHGPNTERWRKTPPGASSFFRVLRCLATPVKVVSSSLMSTVAHREPLGVAHMEPV